MNAAVAVFLALLAAGVAEAQTSSTSNTNTIGVNVVGLHCSDGGLLCSLFLRRWIPGRPSSAFMPG